jgi:hypothetical protein
MPLYMIERYKKNLLKLRAIYIDVGHREEFAHIRVTSAKFSTELAKQSIPHVFEIYEKGDHGNKIRERIQTSVMPFFSRTLER